MPSKSQSLYLDSRSLICCSRYKRPYPYTFAEFIVNDYPPLVRNDPTLLNIGGNTNGVSTFTGLDIGDLTGGVINGQNLLQGDNFACFCQFHALLGKKASQANISIDYRLLMINLENKLPSVVGAGLITLGGTLGEVIDVIFGRLIKGSGGTSSCPTFTGKDIHGFTQYCSVRSQPGTIL